MAFLLCHRRSFPLLLLRVVTNNNAVLLASAAGSRRDTNSAGAHYWRNHHHHGNSRNPLLGFVHHHHRGASSSSSTTVVARQNISAAAAAAAADGPAVPPTRKVAIVGGGLAGLSAAYHLLHYDAASSVATTSSGMQITIYDGSKVGEGGASSVAGGLIHPFSPRGKLIKFGAEALSVAEHLIGAAARHRPECVVRDRLYRVALTENNVDQLQKAAENHPEYATWLSGEEMNDKFGGRMEEGEDSSSLSLGGLEIAGGGCGVVHVPTYLRGLWEECQRKAEEMDGRIRWEMMHVVVVPGADGNDVNSFDSRLLDGYDAVILSAGAGILHDGLVDCGRGGGGVGSDDDGLLPVHLVRGQSVEMSMPPRPGGGSPDSNVDGPNAHAAADEAFLCGKYVSPLPPCEEDEASSQQNASLSSRRRRFVIGATHEFKEEALGTDEVVEELKSRTYPLAKNLWDNGEVERVTTGVRVQSHRGRFGRMPIIGRYDNAGDGAVAPIGHRNLWLFTGLSSRGLVYHGLFGRWLADAVLHDDEGRLRERFDEFDWWQKKMKKEAKAKVGA